MLLISHPDLCPLELERFWPLNLREICAIDKPEEHAGLVGHQRVVVISIADFLPSLLILLER